MSLFESEAPEAAAAIEQASAFPTIVGAEIAALTYGKREAGDYYDSFRVGTERVLFGLLDIAGRRAANLNILSAAQGIFRDAGKELFAGIDINESEAMTTLCLRLNRGLMEAAAGVHSCPAFIGCYHEKFGTLCYTNAGHTPGLLRDGTGLSQLASTGLPLGLFSHATADAPTVGIAKGAVLLLVSRGVVEAKCKEKTEETSAEEFGLARIEDGLRSAPGTTAQALAESILQAAGEFSCEPVVPEDMTALCLLRTS